MERKIRDIVTKFNTFEVQNLIPYSLPGLNRQISIRFLIRNLRRAIPLFFLKKKKRGGWIKNEVSHTKTTNCSCVSSIYKCITVVNPLP